jgi:hypothetical protein
LNFGEIAGHNQFDRIQIHCHLVRSIYISNTFLLVDAEEPLPIIEYKKVQQKFAVGP